MKLLVLFFSLLLYGCASGMKVSVPDSYTEVSTARGYLVGVIGASAIWPQTGENLNNHRATQIIARWKQRRANFINQ